MMEDWVECEVGEIFKIVSGSTPKGLKEVCNKGEIPFYKVSDMNHVGNEVHMKKSNIMLTTEEFKKLRLKSYPKGTIIFPKRGGAILTNKKRVLIEDSAFDLNLMGVLPLVYVDNSYCFFWFQKLDLSSIYDGSNVPQINNKNILPLKFSLPPLPIQRAIVSKIEILFSSLDSGIADLKKAQAQLKIYRQAVLKKAFEGELTKEWREQQTDLPSAEELMEHIKAIKQEYYEKQIEEWESKVKKWEENGKEGKKPKKPRPLTVPDLPNEIHNHRKWKLPNNWLWTQIGLICFVTKLAGFEYTDYVNYDDEGDLPVLKAENAGPLGFKKTEFSKVKSESVKMLKRSQIFGGELLIVFVGAGTGRVAMVPYNQKYFLGPNIGMARPYFKLNSKYLELFLQSGIGKNLLMSAVKAVAQPSLSMGTIRQAPVAFPSLEEQNQVAKKVEFRLSVCDKVEKDIKDSLVKAKALRQSILKKAFEGKLLTAAEVEKCKQEADYEPASVLLERIKKEKDN